MATPTLFDTRTMLGALDTMLPQYSFLLDTFFNEVNYSMTEYVDIDIYKNKRKMAPFVSYMSEGRVLSREGFKTYTFKPPYIKPKMPTSVADLLKRQMGDNIYSNRSMAQRMATLMVRDLADMEGQISRREEWMAAQALTTGKVQVTGDGVNVLIDFLWTASHSKVHTDCTGGGGWNGGSADPLQDLDDWQLLIAQDSGQTADICILGKTAWADFISNAKVIAEMDKWRLTGTAFNRTNQRTGAIFQGIARGKEIWTYNEWYIDDNGVEQPMVPDKQVIMGARSARCSRNYGAIMDLSAGPGGASMRIFPKSWEEQDPSVRYVMLQSSPLPAVHEVDAFVRALIRS